ncbi:MAG: porin [Spongiibacteraceae bacterium]
MKRTLLAITMASIAAANVQAADAPSMEEMWNIIQQQQAEIQRLKNQVNKNDEKLEITEVKLEATAEAVDSVSTGNLAKAAQWASKTSIGGYGEHHFNHFEDKDDLVDAHRFVVYFGHQFTDTVRLFSEVELEHGLVEGGEDSPGEVELEQAYIEWDFAAKHSVVIGQYLIPVGVINETHEPDSFYGAERNPVEKNIIPATWWETGVMTQGEIMPGLSYNMAVHSGLKVDDDGTVRGGRQKSANATAEDLAYTGRLKYTGVKGLEIAATYQHQQDITQGVSMDGNDATLLEAHVRYQISGLTVTGLWVEWDIDGEGFELNGTDKQKGWYVEASYKVLPNLGVFIRQNTYDNFAGNNVDTEVKQFDYGVNYWLTETVVIKADYSDEDKKGSTDNDAFNLGLGWSF